MSPRQDSGRQRMRRVGEGRRRASRDGSILCECAMNTLSEDRRLPDATHFCSGQRRAATTTEGVQRMHTFRVGRIGGSGQGGQSLEKKKRDSRGDLYESCMGRRATYMHTTTTKEEEDRSGDSPGCLIFAITRRTSDWLGSYSPERYLLTLGQKANGVLPPLALSPPRNKNSRPPSGGYLSYIPVFTFRTKGRRSGAELEGRVRPREDRRWCCAPDRRTDRGNGLS
jgi:hypothetical protein